MSSARVSRLIASSGVDVTPRQRVLRSLEWGEPDRVPIQTYLTPEAEASLAAHFGNPDVAGCLGVDFRQVHPIWRGPLPQAADGVTFDIWGTGYRRTLNAVGGTYDEAVVPALAGIHSMADIERYPWPDPDDYDYSTIGRQCRAHDGYAIILGDAGMPDILNGVSRGRGMEQVLVDIALRDEVGLAIIDRRCEFYLEVLRRGLAAARGQVDIVQLGEDCGNQNGRMFSPRDFAEIFRPRLKAFYDLAHQFGAKAMMHSCGDTHEIMPAFMEMGLDVLDAMQPEPAGMNPETIRAACRGRLAFCGLISTQRTLPFGSVEECRAEARHRLDVIAPGGGYVFSSAHCIQPDTPVANILAVYEEALGRSLS